MSYFLILGLICIIVPLLIIEILAIVVFVSFLKDDNAALGLLKMCMGFVVFGIVLLLVHYIPQWIA